MEGLAAEADRFKYRLQGWIKTGINPGRTVSVIPVPAIDLAQGGSELAVGVADGAGDFAFREVEDRPLGR